MTWENTSTDFTERVHRGPLPQERGNRNTTRHWRALLQQSRRRERMRIARDLHDTLLQGFLAASLQLCLADDGLPADSQAKPMLKRALDLIRKGLDDARATLLGLRSAPLPQGSLESALANGCDAFSPGSRTRLSFVILGQSKPLAPAIHDQMYWIAREALLNALHHSAAGRIEVEMEYRPRKLRVAVRDDGAGIDPQALRSARRSHFGLTGMHERAAAIGAKVCVWSKPGEGTEVEISLPLPGRTA